MPKVPLHELDVFTTGDAAKACHVSQQTIIRCFDSGTLKGFRVPGSRFRRIPREKLMDFMKENGIPMDMVESPIQQQYLHLLTTPELQKILERNNNGSTITYNSSFDLGLQMPDLSGTLVVDDRSCTATGLDSITKVLGDIRNETPEKLRSVGILSRCRPVSKLPFDDILGPETGNDELAEEILAFHKNRNGKHN